jgi:hypothetical protein
MRNTFTLNDTNHLQSAIRRRKEPHVLTVGSKLVLRAGYRTPHGMVPAGAVGFVDHVDEESGAVWILMEGIEPALFHWDNTLIIVPYDTEDLVDCLEVTALAVPKLVRAG